MNDKIHLYGNTYCAYCGEKLSIQYQDYQEYYECNCNSARHNRELDHSIRILEKQRIMPNYRVEQVLVKKNGSR